MSTPTNPTGAPRAGDVIAGKFRVERVLGEGGMGVVVAATNLALGQLVALKFMLPQASANPENIARFEREARAAVRLKSEHVARVSDVGHLDDGATYMVMEYLEGEDLAAMLERQGPLPVSVAVDYVLQVCEAIAEAHALGIVHRDLKPRNLFLTRRASGRPLVKVLDFGISKVADPLHDMTLTATQQVLGSPLYMAPEQFRSARDADARTDIWALGVILYQLLTDRAPFIADTITQLTAMVIQDRARPIGELRPDVPADIAEAIERCMEKHREYRYQSVAELVRAIQPFASQEGAAVAREILETTVLTPRPDRPSATRSAAGATTKVSGLDQTERSTATSITSIAPPKRPPYALVAVIAMVVGGAAAATMLLGRGPESAGVAPPPSARERPLETSATAEPPARATSQSPPSVAPPIETAPLVSGTASSPKPEPRTPARPLPVATAHPAPPVATAAPVVTAAPPPPTTSKPNDLPSTRD